MTRFLLRSLFAVSLVMCASSCSKDIEIKDRHTTPENQISFNVNAGSSTRGVDITTGNIRELTATALWKESVDKTAVLYFNEVPFTRNGLSFVSDFPYYWPQKGVLDFYAFSPSVSDQVDYSSSGLNMFKVTPDDAAANQVDFIYANTNGKSKSALNNGITYGLYGVPLNFRHTENKVTVKVKNSSETLKFNITGVRLAYLSKSGTFTYATIKDNVKDESTDGSGTLNAWDWTFTGENEAPSVSNTYEQSFSEVAIQSGMSTATGLNGTTDWILLPQTVSMATKYETEETGEPACGSYISLNVEIRNDDQNTDEDGKKGLLIYKGWAMWPVTFDWSPGYHYTYTVDLVGGGYYETNQENINPGTADLDPILDGALITFVPVDICQWENVNNDVDVIPLN